MDVGFNFFAQQPELSPAEKGRKKLYECVSTNDDKVKEVVVKYHELFSQISKQIEYYRVGTFGYNQIEGKFVNSIGFKSKEKTPEEQNSVAKLHTAKLIDNFCYELLSASCKRQIGFSETISLTAYFYRKVCKLNQKQQSQLSPGTKLETLNDFLSNEIINWTTGDTEMVKLFNKLTNGQFKENPKPKMPKVEVKIDSTKKSDPVKEEKDNLAKLQEEFDKNLEEAENESKRKNAELIAKAKQAKRAAEKEAKEHVEKAQKALEAAKAKEAADELARLQKENEKKIQEQEAERAKILAEHKAKAEPPKEQPNKPAEQPKQPDGAEEPNFVVKFLSAAWESICSFLSWIGSLFQ